MHNIRKTYGINIIPVKSFKISKYYKTKRPPLSVYHNVQLHVKMQKTTLVGLKFFERGSLVFVWLEEGDRTRLLIGF